MEFKIRMEKEHKQRKFSEHKVWTKVEGISPNRRVKINMSDLNSQI